MARLSSEKAKIRKQVAKSQGRAKLVGALYLLALLGFLIVAVFPVMQGGAVSLTIKNFFAPVKKAFDGGFSGLKELSFADARNAIISLLYAGMLIGLLCNFLRGLSKLNWLFKTRDSRINGVNRNMYAMDDISKRYSGSLGALVLFNLLIYILSGVGVYAPTMVGYLVLGAGLALHFLLGGLGGSVVLFTVGDKPEKIDREKGLFVFLIRNILQVVSLALTLYFLLPQSVLAQKLEAFFQTLTASGFSAINYQEYIPVCVELLAWLFIFVLIKHATADTEYNREGIFGSGMHNFRIFSFFVFLATGTLVAFAYMGFHMTQMLNAKLIAVSAISLVSFILDCIIHPRYKDHDKVPDGYFTHDNKYTII